MWSDYGYLPSYTNADVQTYTRASTVTNTQWMTWHRPRGKSHLYIFADGKMFIDAENNVGTVENDSDVEDKEFPFD